jgi:hypothetical protein
MSGLCEGPRCRDKQSRIRRVNSGTRLCASCHAQLASHLAVLPDLYRRCEGILVNTRGRDLERVHGGLPGGISLNDAAVAVRTEMMTVLASWAGLVVDERQVSRPQRRDIHALTDFLAVQLGWLALHPAAGELAAEIGALVRSAEDTISPDTAVRVELGPCNRSGCSGVVSVVVGGDDEPTPTMMSCDSGHALPPQQWLMLKHRIEQARYRSRMSRDERAERVV